MISNTDRPEKSDEEISHEVAAIFARTEGDVPSPANTEKIQKMLLADARVADAFIAQVAVVAMIENLGEERKAALIASSMPRRGFTAFVARPQVAAPSAALLLLTMMAGWAAYRTPGLMPKIYEAGPLAPMHVDFPDGNEALLRAGTKLRWKGLGMHAVVLEKGEALFDVAGNANDPFVVEASGGNVRVLGTKFNVYRNALDVVFVSVLEGTVSASASDVSNKAASAPREVSAQQELAYSAGRIVRDVSPAPPGLVMDWDEGMMVLSGKASLGDAAEVMSRYSALPIIVHADVGKLEIRGKYRVRDTAGFVAALEKACQVVVVRTANSITLKAGSASASNANVGCSAAQ